MNQANASIEGSGSVVTKVHKVLDVANGKWNLNRRLLQWNISSDFSQSLSFFPGGDCLGGRLGNMGVYNPVNSSF